MEKKSVIQYFVFLKINSEEERVVWDKEKKMLVHFIKVAIGKK